MANGSPNTTAITKSSRKDALSNILPFNVFILFFILAALIIFAGLLIPNFLKAENLLNLIRIVSLTGVMAVGITFVLLLGEIDLSVGSNMSLSAVVGGQMLETFGTIPAILVTLCMGIAMGFVNGIGTVKGKIPSLIMTLATLIIYAGLAHVLVSGTSVFTYKHPSYTWIGKGAIIGIPFPIIVFGTTVLLSIIILHFTRFGRWIYYTGANTTASWYSGGDVAKIRIITFVICGFCASCTGPMVAATIHRIWPSQGVGYELAAITIALLGGTSLWGGQGSVIGTFLAALVFGCLINILNLSGVGTYLQEVVKGCLLVVVVGVMALRERRAN